MCFKELDTYFQVAEGIRRLREEVAFASTSGASTGQPPTPSTTPGPAYYAHALAAAQPPLQQQPLGIIPEHLAESINSLRRDEGLGRVLPLPHLKIEVRCTCSFKIQLTKAFQPCNN